MVPIEKETNKNIDVSVEFASVIQLEKKIGKEELEKIVLIKVPSDVYREIRNIIMFLFEKSGFSKINIAGNIDFSKLYENRNTQK